MVWPHDDRGRLVGENVWEVDSSTPRPASSTPPRFWFSPYSSVQVLSRRRWMRPHVGTRSGAGDVTAGDLHGFGTRPRLDGGRLGRRGHALVGPCSRCPGAQG